MDTLYLYFLVVQLLIAHKDFVQCHSHTSIPSSASLVLTEKEEMISVTVIPVA